MALVVDDPNPTQECAPPRRRSQWHCTLGAMASGAFSGLIGAIGVLAEKPQNSHEVAQVAFYGLAYGLGYLAWKEAGRAADKIKNPDHVFKWKFTRGGTMALAVSCGALAIYGFQAMYFSGGFERKVEPVPNISKIIEYSKPYFSRAPRQP